MTSELLIRDVENQTKKFYIKEYLTNIIFGRVHSFAGNFKNDLKDLQESLEKNVADLSSFKDSSEKELEKTYLKFKKFNAAFDKLNDLYYSKNYFEDNELKGIFRSITRNLHKIENFSYKYLNKDVPADSTPSYIKEGLINFSKENIAKRLAPEN